MRTVAVLPVKRFADAKRRLGDSVADVQRRELAAAMVADVLDALAATSALDATIVVSGEPTIAPRVRDQGAILVQEAGGRGQSAAALHGIRRALAEGARRVLCVPGDCPALDPAELNVLLAGEPHAPSTQVVVVPDRHGTGTNGLLLCPPGAIAPSFGPGSCERHLALARAAGVRARVERVPSLLLDVDTAADLAALRARLQAGRGGRLTARTAPAAAEHTLAALARLERSRAALAGSA